jgi:hypothetical protein
MRACFKAKRAYRLALSSFPPRALIRPTAAASKEDTLPDRACSVPAATCSRSASDIREKESQVKRIRHQIRQMQLKLQVSLRLILSTAFVARMVGYASAGQNFEENKVSQIKKGKTTEAELVQMFGEPQSRGRNPDGTTNLTWQCFESRVKGETVVPIAAQTPAHPAQHRTGQLRPV